MSQYNYNVQVTYADTTPQEQDFDFKPTTSLRDGLCVRSDIK